jgi:hypothetical protein
VQSLAAASDEKHRISWQNLQCEQEQEQTPQVNAQDTGTIRKRGLTPEISVLSSSFHDEIVLSEE